uniref:Chalcone--flavanone isomerase n=1 Tax=Crocus sativus TaxID=82528 RepID=A0A411MRB3_CROSA|nr:chalcone isomerase [Crocus sativus]
MRNNWVFFTSFDIDGGGHYTFPTDSQLSQGFGANLLSHFSSLVDLSLHHSSHFVNSGSLALQEAFSCMSKFAGAFVLWSSTRPNSNIPRKSSSKPRGSTSRNYQSSAPIKHVTASRKGPVELLFSSGSDAGFATPMVFAKLARSAFWHLWKHVEQNKFFPVLSLSAALVPPFDNLSSKVLAESISLGNSNGQMHHSFSEDDCRRCHGFAISNITWARDAIEPITGINFPRILNSSFGREDNPHLPTEVLVGTGSRSMKIIRIKSLKVYAFALYIHPDSVCEKLGPKYSSVPFNELKNRSEFFEDLLREDIHMTIRLVVNCNGVKINTVRESFEKSLRNRLQKMNPSTDYHHCLKEFGSYFKQDIPLPVGTTIDFRQTAAGELITESESFFST